MNLATKSLPTKEQILLYSLGRKTYMTELYEKMTGEKVYEYIEGEVRTKNLGGWLSRKKDLMKENLIKNYKEKNGRKVIFTANISAFLDSMGIHKKYREVLDFIFENRFEYLFKKHISRMIDFAFFEYPDIGEKLTKDYSRTNIFLLFMTIATTISKQKWKPKHIKLNRGKRSKFIKSKKNTSPYSKKVLEMINEYNLDSELEDKFTLLYGVSPAQLVSRIKKFFKTSEKKDLTYLKIESKSKMLSRLTTTHKYVGEINLLMSSLIPASIHKKANLDRAEKINELLKKGKIE